ncbi:MAG: hypothetical protein PUG56_03970 [Ruminococcus sp.]|nr:hypothetical protein [Ruminococcus sp.]
MIYEDNYNEYLELTYEICESRKLKTGAQVQDHCLYDTDESSLTERERFIMILSVIMYETEHNILTPEIKGELGYYYRTYKNGLLSDMLGDDEREQAIKDLCNCYDKVFNQ